MRNSMEEFTLNLKSLPFVDVGFKVFPSFELSKKTSLPSPRMPTIKPPSSPIPQTEIEEQTERENEDIVFTAACATSLIILAILVILFILSRLSVREERNGEDREELENGNGRDNITSGLTGTDEEGLDPGDMEDEGPDDDESGPSD